MQIVKCAKDLLSSLYDKVVLSKGEEAEVGEEPEVEKVPIQPKEYVMPLHAFTRAERPRENPNYVGKEHIRKLDERTVKELKEPQIAFLSMIKVMQTTR